MKSIKFFVLSAIVLLASCSGKASKEVASSESKVVVAYVTSWSSIMPNPEYMTHINYAFGHVGETFDGVVVDNEARLREIVALRQQNPELKIMLSIGGWGSGRFSEMAANDALRLLFAKDCDRVVKEFALDGIDIDWEYPTSNEAGISASPSDTDNFTLLMRDIRNEIGDGKLLTLATVAWAEFIDFKAILPYIDFVNIMSYDMGNAPQHHASLYRSENSGKTTADEAVKAHIEAGVPACKLNMGVPFYGRGGGEYPRFMNYNKLGEFTQLKECWDETAQSPYLADENGVLVYGFDNPRSLLIKCQYIKDNGLLGGMYWECAGDNEQEDLARTMYEGLIKQ